METGGDRQVVPRAQRGVAQAVEVEPGNPVRGEGHDQVAPHDRQGDGTDGGPAGQPHERLIEFAARHIVHRHLPGAQSAHTLPPVIAGTVHDQQFQPLLDQPDERQEGIAPRLALEQVVGGGVGRGHHHHAAVEQRLEQPPQNHRVGDVVDLEFVEAQQRRLARDLVGERRDWVGDFRVRPLIGVDSRVDALDEAMEMDALFARHQRGVEEQVHQHGLSAPDLADQIQAGRHVFLGMAADQARQQPAAGGWRGPRVVVAQPLPQILQPVDRDGLRGIGRQGVAGDHGLVGRQRAGLQ